MRLDIKMNHCQLVIIGAGPHGISLAKMAQERGISCVIIEKKNPCQLARDLPDDLEFATEGPALGLDMNVQSILAKEFVDYYDAYIKLHNLTVWTEQEVVKVDKKKYYSSGKSYELFLTSTTDHDVESSNVVIATGHFSTPRKLGAPGEEFALHRVNKEPNYDKDIVVIGSGNSAANAIIRNAEDNSVYWVIRGELDTSTIFYKWRDQVETLIKSGKITVISNTLIDEFTIGSCITQGGVINADLFYVLIGYDTDHSVGDLYGVTPGNKDVNTCETNIPGVYLFGSLADECQVGGCYKRVMLSDSKILGEQLLSHIVASRNK
jgi:thioredoxin reductase (NADPH)